jgi:hypothetical protein
MAMPRRMSSSLPVQQTPTRLMPLAPLALARPAVSDWQAGDHHSDTTGLWPCTTMLTWSSFKTPALTMVARRGGHAEKDVGHLGGDHGTAPAVGQGVAHALQQQAHPVVVHPHVGAVHHFRGLAVDAPGGDAQLFPYLPGLFGRAGDQLGRPFSACRSLPSWRRPVRPAMASVLLPSVAVTRIRRPARELALIPDGVAWGLAFGHARPGPPPDPGRGRSGWPLRRQSCGTGCGPR